MERYGPRTESAQSGAPDTLYVRLLGVFRVWVGSRLIADDEWRLRKAKSLIKLLALAPDHRLHRERIMDLLWPELAPKAAANNLNYALYVARRLLEPERKAGSQYLCLRGEQVVLCPEGPLWVDVEAFEEAESKARRDRELAAYRVAVEQYTGELLPEDRYEDWVEGRRAELRRTYQALLTELAGMYEARGETGAAVETLQELARDTPAHEEAQVGLMRLYTAAGQRHQALRQYERLEEALRGLGTEPDAASRRLYEEILAGRVSTVRPPPAGRLPMESPRHNLPVTLSSFVGREREINELRALLGQTRLLTLTGPGGCGKTRLALEMAKEIVDGYPEGVWLVELAALSEATLLPQTVAGALSVQEQQFRQPLEMLVDELRPRELLLVLDNCEHLVDACARFVEKLLGECPRVRLLATSREVLRLPEETVWRVPPLSLPNPRRPQPAGYLTEFEAVRLFVDRARARQPGFAPTDRNARCVAEICRQLDGIPLAIELAAAKVGVLEVDQISARLGDRFRLLGSGSRTAPDRQQTLRGTLGWSHDLLSPPERELSNRLSVFAGGFSLEAAEAVGAGEGIVAGDVPELLSRLVDKSWVAAEAGGESDVRYGMLQTIRQYGLERLEENGEEEQVRQRHAEHYLDLAERAERDLTGPEQALWLERLEAEHDNLRAALSWLLAPREREEKRAELGLRLAGALWWFWNMHGLDEGRRWLEAALETDSSVSAAVRAKALDVASWIAFSQRDESAITMLEETASLFRKLGDKPGVAGVLTNLGIALLCAGESERARALREEVEALRRDPIDRRSHTNLALFLGMLELDEDDPERAIAMFESSLATFRGLEDPEGVTLSLLCLGLTELGWGDPERAAILFEERLRLVSKLRDKVGIAYCLLGLAGAAGLEGQPERAARLWGAAEILREEVGLPLSPLGRAHYDYERYLSIARSQLDEEAWTAAWAEGKAMTQEEAIEYALAAEQPEKEPGHHLSRRELEVAELLAQGLTNRQISAELVISKRTADNHVGNILRKLGLSSREHAAAWWEEQG